MKNEDWNESGTPLAYLITFRCYGTWLHGDERGSIDKFNNRYGMPLLPANERWHEFTKKILKHKPVRLNGSMRKAVMSAIRETCSIRGWQIYAINVRTNHAHIVVAIGSFNSRKALIDFKANATRKMRENKIWTADFSPWSESGSRRYLWNERSIERAIDYVINGQGRSLPDFSD